MEQEEIRMVLGKVGEDDTLSCGVEVGMGPKMQVYQGSNSLSPFGPYSKARADSKPLDKSKEEYDEIEEAFICLGGQRHGSTSLNDKLQPMIFEGKAQDPSQNH